MVPVSAFAAVVALAGPQRLAAESSVQDAADDLAMFAVAWRDGHDMSTGELPAFPPECAARSEATERRSGHVGRQPSSRSIRTIPTIARASRRATRTAQRSVHAVQNETAAVPGHRYPADPADLAASKVELRARFDDVGVAAGRVGERLRGLCPNALLRDLGYLGVDMGSLRGFYSDSLTESPMTESCSDPQYTTTGRVHRGECRCGPPPQAFASAVPDVIAGRARGGTSVVVQDAVHVALTGQLAGRGLGPRRRCGPTGCRWLRSRWAGSAGAIPPPRRLRSAVSSWWCSTTRVGRCGRARAARLPTRGSWLSRWGAPRCRAE